MPALNLSIDGKTLATVSTEGLNILSVRAHGTVVEAELANLEMTGGAYPENGESSHLIWINAHTLQAGQIIKVAMLADAVTSHAGQTIDELFANEDEPIDPANIKPISEIYGDLRKLPRLRERIPFRVESSIGESATSNTRPEDHLFTFSVLWDSWSPDYAKVSVHSCSLDDLEQRSPMNDFFRCHIHVGESIEFELTT